MQFRGTQSPPSQDALGAWELKSDMLRLAEEGAKPRDIVDIALRGAPVGAVGPIVRLEACKRRRRKRFQGGDPPEHRGQEDLAASDAYEELGYGRRPLYRDNGSESNSRRPGGTCHRARKEFPGVLKQPGYLFGARDFAMAPVSLLQIYGVRAAPSDMSVTAAYCLLGGGRGSLRVLTKDAGGRAFGIGAIRRINM